MLKIQNKNDTQCGLCCIIAHLHPVKANACTTKFVEKSFIATIRTGINLENGIIF